MFPSHIDDSFSLPSSLYKINKTYSKNNICLDSLRILIKLYLEVFELFPNTVCLNTLLKK